jgi:transketolase
MYKRIGDAMHATDHALPDEPTQRERALSELRDLAREVRINALTSIYHAGSGHPGGVLSSADLVTYILWREAREAGPVAEDRDRFILSKGHSCPTLYAAAAEFGLLDRGALIGLRKLGSPLQGHPDVKSLPWVHTSTGSLGQGFSAAIGMSLGLRFLSSSRRVNVMLGDGELQEGEVWEGAMFAAHRGLGNLCAVVDYNKMQSDDLNANIVGLEPLADKWRAFGWNVAEIDGHDFERIDDAFASARRSVDRPTVVIAHTVKGKGVGFMEAIPAWHGSLMLSDAQLTESLAGLGVPADEIPGYLAGSVWTDGGSDGS